LTLLWKRQNVWAAALSPPLGLACSLVAWLVTAKSESGELTVLSTGANNPMLAGNVVALLSPCIFIPILTYGLGSEDYDYESMRQIRRADDSELAKEAHVDLSLIPGSAEAEEAEQRHLNRAAFIARILTVVMAICFLVLLPMPIYGSGYIFSSKFFTGWVTVGIIWLFFSAFCVGLFPLWEGRHSMAHTFRSIYRDITGQRQIPASSTIQGRPPSSEDEAPSRQEEKVVVKV